ncbi:MAG: type VI secretion system protein TssA [Desulfovibrio sp.]|nr:type VI secretion system protein TssA [Desulfovibrio sp.]
MADFAWADYLAPISAEEAAGHDARYDDPYTELLAEIEKLGSVTRAVCDWRVVIAKSSLVLKDLSKDFLAASYLAVALIHENGLDGAIAGIKLLAGLTDGFWQNGFPQLKRVRARINALDWWRERFEESVTAWQSEQEQPAASIESLQQALESLDEALAKVLPDYPPLRDLREKVARIPTKAEEKAAEAEPAEAESIAAKADTAEPVTPAGAPLPVFGEDLEKNLDQFKTLCLDFVRFGQPKDTANPLYLQLRRLAAWGKIRSLPASEQQTTMIPAPASEQKALIQHDLGEGRAQAAFLACEELCLAAPFWLDLQRLAAEALAQLGSSHAAVLGALQGECAIFLKRFPGLETLRFADGTPFADSQTTTWLATLSRSGADDAEAQNAKAPDGLEAAQQLAAKGQLGKALDLLDNLRSQQASLARAFPYRLAQAQILLQARQMPGALALARELSELCTSLDLVRWDPDRALEALELCRRIYTEYGGEKGLRQAWEISERMSQIRPSSVLTE